MVFIFTLCALVALFVVAIKEVKAQEKKTIEQKVIELEKKIREIIIDSGQGELKKRFRESGFEILEIDDIKAEQILNPPPLAIPKPIKERLEDGRLKVYLDKDRILFELIGPNSKRVLSAKIKRYDTGWILAAFGGVGFTILILYWTIYRSLFPLKKLALQIKRFGDGDMSISTKSQKKDEIAFVANQFDATVKKIRSMKEARTLFMRNIMHELKTPITKGKLSISFLEKSYESKILEQVFNRMEHLIQEMFEIEKIVSQSIDLRVVPCNIKNVIEDALELLFANKRRVKVTILDKRKFCADYNLLVIVMKNLIDNAIKYGSEDSIEVRYIAGKIEVINRGEPLKESASNLLEPFRKDSNIGSKDSFGLGLYIVKSILDAHGATLSHRYERGRHIFSIDGLQPAG